MVIVGGEKVENTSETSTPSFIFGFSLLMIVFAVSSF